MSEREFDPECAICHCQMSLMDGCEWPDDDSLVMCWPCMVSEVTRLRAALEKILEEWRDDSKSLTESGIAMAKVAREALGGKE